MEFTLRNLPKHQTIWNLAHEVPDVTVSSIETYLLFLRVASDVFAALQSHLERFDLSDGKLSVLLELRSTPEGFLTPSALAEQIGVKRGTITDLLAGLERSGFILRAPSPEDGRMVIVQLTPKGNELLDRLLPEHFQRLQGLMNDLSEEEKQELVRLLQKISRGLPALQP